MSSKILFKTFDKFSCVKFVKLLLLQFTKFSDSHKKRKDVFPFLMTII